METTDLFQEDASLPSQYWDTFAKKRDLEPEKRLLLAVLDNAVRAYRSCIFTGGRRFTEVEGWLFNDGSEDTFSFKNICDVLGLDPGRIRQSLKLSSGVKPRRAPTERQAPLRAPRPRTDFSDRQSAEAAARQRAS
ncbi:MAG TPA: hypothetical protein VGA73_05195 [Candidatus Binatia bacterium]